MHLVLGVAEHELEENATACAGAWDEQWRWPSWNSASSSCVSSCWQAGHCAGAPLAATSWTHPWIKHAIVEFPGAGFADFDFCMFGMVAEVHRAPLKKATRRMSNDPLPHVLKRFAGVLCDGAHAHAWRMGCEGGEKQSRYAQYYPDL